MKKVFVNGTFDILHLGHMELISTASNSGDYLMLAIDSDRRVSEKKGPQRPIHDQNTRSNMLMYIKGVNEVKIFDTDEDLINIVKEYEPDIMIVGSDYRNAKVIGSEYAKQLNFFERIEEYSSTKIIKNIVNRR